MALVLPMDTGVVSDGYHTFDELYAHRQLLFAALMLQRPDISWRASFHDDGGSFEGYFVAGMLLPNGMVTYHLEDQYWDFLKGVETLRNAPAWDGHDSAEVLKRLKDWLGALGEDI